jgi:hypothetical protein
MKILLGRDDKMALFISLLKNSNINYIKKKLLVLYILNVTDILFTLFLINTGAFVEGNSVMAALIDSSQLSSLFLKLLLPLALICWIAYRMKKATQNQLIRCNFTVNLCLVFYGIINIFHMLWSALYCIFSLFC